MSPGGGHRYARAGLDTGAGCSVHVGPHCSQRGQSQGRDYQVHHLAWTGNGLQGGDWFDYCFNLLINFKVGQIKILELRSRAEEALGDDFDIREFHQIVLKSVGPLEILERQIDGWINSYL